MTDINKAILIGRLVRDPDSVAYTSGGTARLGVSIAVNRSEKRGGEWADKASFFDITIWGKTAENDAPQQAQGYKDAGSGDDFPEDMPF